MHTTACTLHSTNKMAAAGSGAGRANRFGGVTPGGIQERSSTTSEERMVEVVARLVADREQRGSEAVQLYTS